MASKLPTELAEIHGGDMPLKERKSPMTSSLGFLGGLYQAACVHSLLRVPISISV